LSAASIPTTGSVDKIKPEEFIYDYQVDYGDMSKGKPHPFDEKTITGNGA
jgi:hypothetical protein